MISPPGVANSPPDRLLFEIERTINGQSAEARKAVRQELSAPLVAELQAWMRAERGIANRLILSPAVPGTMSGTRSEDHHQGAERCPRPIPAARR